MGISAVEGSAVAAAQTQSRLAIDTANVRQAAQQEQQAADTVTEASAPTQSASPTAAGVGGVVDISA